MGTSDEPIWRPEDDVLGRNQLARLIAESLNELGDPEGAVVGIMGPWGSGKTSLIKLVEHHLKQESRLRTVWFNPWLFSGTNELVERFFEELSAQLGEDTGKLGEVAKSLATFGKALTPLHSLPFVGSSVKGATDAATLADDIIRARKGGVQKQRTNLEEKLRHLDTKLLVIIDDIDRLETDEIKEIFKLVRLTGNFPRVIYLLAFDRMRVERALGEAENLGRHYLEKIVQIRATGNR